MNPYRAVAGQAAGMSASMLVAFLFGTEPIFWVLTITVALYSANNLTWISVYAVARRRAKPVSAVSRWRRRGDALAVLEVVAPPTVFVACALVFGTAGPFRSTFGGLTIATVACALAMMLAAVTGSSMVDWFYIRAFRDGVVREPPCMSADDARWAALTKTWLIHRLVAEAAFVLFFALTGVALVLEGVSEAGVGGWVRTAAGAAIAVAGIVLKYSSSRLRISLVGMPGANRTVRFAVGETISWHANSNAVIRVRSERRLGLGRFRWHVRRVEQQGKKRPPLHARGSLGYVRDVALDVATILVMNGRKDGSVKGVLEVPMDVLFHESADIERSQISWCARQGRCLRLQERCELASRPAPRLGELS